MSFQGLRVIRGPDWEWGDQDGGEGHVGTVSSKQGVISHLPGDQNCPKEWTVFVEWDCGIASHVNGVIGNYRILEKHDLRLLDSSLTGVHFPNIKCVECEKSEIKGTRWQCCICEDVNLCSNCYMNDKHNTNHPFNRYDSNSDTSVQVSAREGSKKIDYYGVYAGAKVLRDVSDWLESGEDGGIGSFGEVLGEAEEAGKVRVKWDDRLVLEHNMGKNGTVDLWTISPARGGSCYIDHLVLLQSPRTDATSSTNVKNSEPLCNDAGNAEQPCDSPKTDASSSATAESTEPLCNGAETTETKTSDAKNTEPVTNETENTEPKTNHDIKNTELKTSGVENTEPLCNNVENTKQTCDISDNDDYISDKDDYADNDDDDTDVSVCDEASSDDDNDNEVGDDVFRILRSTGGAGDAEFMEFMRRVLGGGGRAADLRNYQATEHGRIPQGLVAKGDRVQIDPDLDPQEFRRFQQEPGTGGWSGAMTAYIGRTGKVLGVLPGRALVIMFSDSEQRWTVSAKAVKLKIFYVGDKLRLSNNEADVRERQKKFGGWIPEMKNLLGRVHTVSHVEEDGTRMMVKLREDVDIELNPWSCLVVTPVENMNRTENLGEIISIKEIEKKLDEGLDPRTPLDLTGNTYQHHLIAKGDNAEGIELLLDRFPDTSDLVNYELLSPLHCAIKYRRRKCAQVLFERGLNLESRDMDGDTPLHYAIIKNDSSEYDVMVELLTQPSSFNYKTVNHQKMNVLQLAAYVDNAYAVKRILERAPELMDSSEATSLNQMQDVSCPLHIACAHGRTDAVKAIIEYDRKYLEKTNGGRRMTPLICSVVHREGATAELLISMDMISDSETCLRYKVKPTLNLAFAFVLFLQGAKVNAVDVQGQTCLHSILGYLLTPTVTRGPLTQIEETNELSQIFRELPDEITDRTPIALPFMLQENTSNPADKSWIALICLLVKYGANLNLRDFRGVPASNLVNAYHQRGLPQLVQKYEKMYQNNSRIKTMKI